MSESSPRDRLEHSLTEVQATREAREEALRTLPRWRFRRRKHIERSVRRREEWEETLREAVSDKREP